LNLFSQKEKINENKMFKKVFSRLVYGGSDNKNNSDDLNNNDNAIYIDKPSVYTIPSTSSSTSSSISISTNIRQQLTSDDYLNNTFRNKEEEDEEQRDRNIYNPVSTTLDSSIQKQIAQKLKNNSTTNNKLQKHTQIYIAPHCVRYTNSTLDTDTPCRLSPSTLDTMAAQILSSAQTPPKLQIVFQYPHYYAINNSHLQIYRQLQVSGLITHVQADIISINAIPLAIRQNLLEMPLQDPIEEELLKSSIDTQKSQGQNIADVLTTECIEKFRREKLVDETYEFGQCENCVEDSSDNGDDDDDEEDLDLDLDLEDDDEDDDDEYVNDNNEVESGIDEHKLEVSPMSLSPCGIDDINEDNSQTKIELLNENKKKNTNIRGVQSNDDIEIEEKTKLLSLNGE
jgi:hypothetical protein